MIRTILFDLDDTLLDFHASETAAITQTLQHMDVPPTGETIRRYSAINAAQWKLLELGELTRQQVLVRRFELLYAELGIQRDPQQTCKLYSSLLSQGCELIPGAVALLEQLSPSYGLYLVSNGNAAVQDSRLARSGLARYFRDVFISELIGYDKPRREFFDHCFARIPGLDRSQTLIVGDSLTSDMQGGLNAGIQTCWFNPQGRPCSLPVTYEITRLDELPPLLAQDARRTS